MKKKTKAVFLIIGIALFLFAVIVLFAFNLLGTLEKISLVIFILAGSIPIIKAILGLFKTKKPSVQDAIENIKNSILNDDWKLEKYYTKFIGHKKKKAEILAFFLKEDPETNTLILSSFGGFGKTAICREILGNLYENGIFKNVIWIQSKKGFYDATNDTIKYESNLERNYKKLLNLLCNKLSIPDSAILDISNIEKTLNQIFTVNKILLVIDGVEDVSNPINTINKISGILSGSTSKMFVTSRKIIIGILNAKNYYMSEFNNRESKLFLNYTAGLDRNLFEIYSKLGEAKIDHICSLAGGNPLILKVVLAQLSFRSYDRVIEKLSGSQNDGLSAYLFTPTWEQLLSTDPLAILVLQLLSDIDDRINMDRIYDFINHFSVKLNKSVSKDEIDQSINSLFMLSLIESSFSGNKRWIKLHSFVSLFVKNQLTNS